MMRVGLIGAGLLGGKRAKNLPASKLVAVYDVNPGRASELAAAHGATAMTKAQDVTRNPDVDAVIVSTTHDSLCGYAIDALHADKHVFLEKPGGRNPRELRELEAVSKTVRRILRVGFNHRFHPAFQKAAELLRNAELGPLLFIRARYGHGGRLGYEKEWRADPSISGGGELLDQGVHLIDLARWLGGEFELDWGRVSTFFWKMPVEDHGVIALKGSDGKKQALLTASWVEWKNIFSFEIACERGKIDIGGLGGSYGPERIQIFRMKREMGPPPVETIDFPAEDKSWYDEWMAFLAAINGAQTDNAHAIDALKALEIVHKVYASNQKPYAAV